MRPAVLSRISPSENASRRRLRKSEARFRYLADYVPTIIWINDALGRCTYVNKQWTEFTGTVFEEQLGFGWLASIHPDDREATQKARRGGNAEP